MSFPPPSPTSRRERILILATALAFFAVAGMDAALLGPASLATLPPTAKGNTAYDAGALSSSDRALYRDAFRLARAGRFGESEMVLSHVRDPLLKGTGLALRYLNPDYQPRGNEMALWLAEYRDQPEAEAIYYLVHYRHPASADGPRSRAGMGGEKSALRANPHWTAGLRAYRNKDMDAASREFRSTLAQRLSPGDRAAAAFWAYRALAAAGDAEGALAYARIAAAQLPGFYSALAREVEGVKSANDEAPDLNDLLANPAAHRAVALKEMGEDALASADLRGLFAHSDDEVVRSRLIALARRLDLPAAETRMALDYAGAEDSNLYPLPAWTPKAGYRIDPALLFAIMRQESGFNPRARNPSGASGVMQLMPATAERMARELGVSGAASLPAVSMALGQGYLVRLMDTPAVGDNLVLLMAAYNAGPGTVGEWRRRLQYRGDPLLFVESIPFAETRDYVVSVLGNYEIYSGLLGARGTSLSAVLSGEWPRYRTSGGTLTSMLRHLPGKRADAAL